MHVKKVDIKVEHLDIKDYRPYLYFAKLPEDFPAHVIEEGAMLSESIPFEKLEYQIMKMHHPEKGLSYVAIQDREVFEEVLEFARGREADLREQGRKKGDEEGYQRCLKECKALFKKLPWWRRLFNLF